MLCIMVWCNRYALGLARIQPPVIYTSTSKSIFDDRLTGIIVAAYIGLLIGYVLRRIEDGE